MSGGASELSRNYGPEVRYRHGIDELLEALGEYDSPPESHVHPLKVVTELLSTGECTVLELGSGWEKEGFDAQSRYGVGVNWIALNPMLKDARHNRRVLDQIEDHAFSVSRHLLRLASDSEPVRRAVAAESRQIPLANGSVDLVLASWSVPTVQEEQVAIMKRQGHPLVEVASSQEGLLAMLDETCAEYSRIVSQGGHVITFPIRDPGLLDAYLVMLGDDVWRHTVCTVYDQSWFAEVNPRHENYLIVSEKIV